jgi:hypothetical protein
MLFGAGLALVVAGSCVFWPSRVTWENYNRIRAGMDRAEVIAILGPPGDYTTGPVIAYGRVSEVLVGKVYRNQIDYHGGPQRARNDVWVTDSVIIVVTVDIQSDKVLDRLGLRAERQTQNMLEWLRRLWRKWFP